MTWIAISVPWIAAQKRARTRTPVDQGRRSIRKIDDGSQPTIRMTACLAAGSTNARLSTEDQGADPQRDELHAAGWDMTLEEHGSVPIAAAPSSPASCAAPPKARWAYTRIRVRSRLCELVY